MSLDAFVLGGLAVGAAVPLIRERYRRPMDSEVRRAATGYFAPLSLGQTHYALLGPAMGPTVVCVHGLTTPSFVWRGLARRLAGLGFRVLIYDLYGRGYSDRPKEAQTPAFFVQQLEDLLQYLEIKGDITLMGYSMGGVIAAAYSAKNPHMLRRTLLIAPAGMGHDLGPVARFATEWPVVGDWLFHMAYPWYLRRGAKAERDIPKSVERLEGMQLSELERRGYLSALVSSLRYTLRQPIPAIHKQLAQTSVPVGAIWGRDDTVIPIAGLGQLTQWNRGVQHEVIDDAGHGLVYTHCEEVAEAIARLCGLQAS